jgi:plastocyanin
MEKKTGIIIAAAFLLAGLTAAITLGAPYTYNTPANATPQTTTQNPTIQPYRGWGMMGSGRGGMMGYGYPTTNQNTTTTWNNMWSRCAGYMNSGQNPQSQQTNHIAIAGYGFTPQVITVKMGTTITWTNYDSATHSITSGTPTTPTTLFDSGELAQGQSWSNIFTTAGVYTYYCDEHPGMTGVVIVEP